VCGLFGIYGRGASLSSEELEDQFSLIRHRGPDGSGLIELPECTLGHTLLAIQNPGFAEQPMKSISGKNVIVFNGEIYNFKDLTQRYNLDNLRTGSDTEVVIELIDRFGVKTIDLFEGMFSFAIFNTESKKLTLARDRFGEKPLFYSKKNGKIFFGSDPRAVKRMSGAKFSFNQDFLGHYLKYQYLPEGSSPFRDVQQLLPGSYSTFDLDQIVEDKRLGGNNYQVDGEEDFSLIFSNSVRDCMVSDVPIGIALSGGIDSAIVLYEATRFNSDIKSFTVLLDKRDESFAREAATLLGSTHHEIRISNDELPELIHRVLSNQPLPFGDSSIIPTYVLAKFAREHVKVLISGDGADEVLSGYTYYRKYGNVQVKNMCLTSEYLKKNAEVWAIRRLFSRKEFSRIARVRELEFVLSKKEAFELWQEDLSNLDELEMQEFGLESNEIRKISRRGFREFRDIQTIMEWDRDSYLPGDILWKSDTAGMMASLEIRTPFLNSKVLAWAQNKEFSNTISKQSIMCAEYAGKIPEHFFARKKMGFGAPLGEWFKLQKIHDLFFDIVGDRSSNLYDFLNISRSVNLSNLKPQTKWNLLALALWLQKHA